MTGRVQGVGFRWWTRSAASSLGLRGTVRNARDGSVRIQVAGDPADLDRFEDRLREGPGPARVDSVSREKPGEDSLPTGFEIVR